MEKQRWEESEKRREEKRRREKNREEQRRTEKNREENESKKEDAGAGKGGKVTIQWFVAPEGRKVGSLKRQVQSHLGRWEMKNCTPLWREAHLQVKKLKTPHIRNTFGSSDVEKDHALVARSTFPSQNVQNPPGPEPGALLEVEMLKKCTPLWREARFQVKTYKAHRVQRTFGSWDVQNVYAVVARSTFRSQNVQSTSASAHFWKLRCRKSARRCGAKHISKSESLKKTHVAPLLDVEASFCVAGARDSAPCQKWTKREGFVAYPKRWQAWDAWRGPAKMHFACHAQYKRHVHQRCWEGLHFGASGLQVC